MLKDFGTNLALLISCFLIIGHIYKGKLVVPQSPIRIRLVYGGLLGMVGVLLMLYAIRVSPTVVADLRQIVIVLAAFFGGMPAALASAVIVAIGRVGLYGVSAASLTAAFFAILIGIGCGFLSYIRLHPWSKIILLNLYGIVVATCSLYMNLLDTSLVSQIAVYQWPISLIGGILSYLVMMYIRRTNHLLYELEESEERYRRLVQLSPDGILVASEGRIVLANDAALKLLGLEKREQLLGKPLYTFTKEEWRAGAWNDTHMQKEPVTDLIETRFSRQDSSEVDVETASTWISYRGEPAQLIHFRDITLRKRAEEQLMSANKLLRDLTNMDGLTGVANRRCFDERVRADWEACQARRVPFSLIMFDVDYFKAYNDTYGHQRGDRCLREAAEAAAAAVSGAELQGALVARYGGEEFAVLLPGADAEQAYEIAEDVRVRIEAIAIPHSGSKVSSVATVSVGVSTLLPAEAISPENAIEQADKALYEAKNAGRNCVRMALQSPL
ncbi:diguanylate cyclase [Brevibacillus borstelensis]|uniref:sensor domain-containing diguanylate cyclase n=1 Tax=Brevibacillus borstelensis TaxID=45462 RepID=UPI0030C5934A